MPQSICRWQCGTCVCNMCMYASRHFLSVDGSVAHVCVTCACTKLLIFLCSRVLKKQLIDQRFGLLTDVGLLVVFFPNTLEHRNLVAMTREPRSLRSFMSMYMYLHKKFQSMTNSVTQDGQLTSNKGAQHACTCTCTLYIHCVHYEMYSVCLRMARY